MSLESLLNQVKVEQEKVNQLQMSIGEILTNHVPTLKNKIKGDQLTGIIGEAIVALKYNGKIVDEKKDYDVIAGQMRIEVKTRKGLGSNWQKTGVIPRNTVSDDGPTHLAFVHLNKDCTLSGLWLFDWKDLVDSERITNRIVRGESRGFTFRLSPKNDGQFKVL